MAVTVIDTIKPKNNGTFPVVEAADVKVSDSKRLDAALDDKANQSDVTALQTAVAGKASQSDLNALSATVSDKADKSALAETNVAVAGKQAALTEAQLTAVNSGITSELVTQIGTNTTAISGKASQADLDTTNVTVATKANTSDVATSTASLQAQIDALVTPVTQDAEVQNARVSANGTAYTTLKEHLDSDEKTLDEVKNELGVRNSLNSYLFAKNSYMSSSGVVTASSGYDIYRIPTKKGDWINLHSVSYDSSPAFWGTLNTGSVCGYMVDSSYSVINTTARTAGLLRDDINSVDFFCISTTAYFYVNVKSEYSSIVKFAKNNVFIDSKSGITSKLNSCFVVTENEGLQTYDRIGNSEEVRSFGTPATGIYSIGLNANKDDVLKFSGLATGMSFYASYYNGTSWSSVTDSSFTVPNNGYILIFVNNADGNSKYKATYYPADSIKIESKNIVDIDTLSKNIIDEATEDIKKIINDKNNIDDYLYQTNAYINSSGEIVSISGYDLYKLTVNKNSWINIHSINYNESASFFDGLSESNVCGFFVNDTYTALAALSSENGIVRSDINSVDFFCLEDTVDFYFNVKTSNKNLAVFTINNMFDDVTGGIVSKGKTSFKVTENEGLKTYCRVGDESEIRSTGTPSTGTFSLGLSVSKDDTISFSGKATAFNYYGSYYNGSEWARINTDSFSASADGYVIIFGNAADAEPYKATYTPADSIKIDYKNIVNFDDSLTFNQFDGMSGVAFGTSLTYRSETTGGYLQYLPTLSGIDFDNEGVGGATIYPFTGDGRIYNAITSYTDYADKDVCILEGFVNDWYQEAPLGVYTDNSDESVCGRVRKAINYIYSQNANITIFLILDHYGKQGTSTNCSSTEVRGEYTQYEFYEEIAKVGDSMGVPVIKQYANSRISENTPQYLLDQIHTSALGAKQSANSIWCEMRQYMPNEKT